MPNEIYYPGIPETDKIKTSQYLLINNERTHKPDKIRLDKFISNLNIQTDEDTTNNLIEVTYAAAQALIASSSLIIGEHYKLTDKADNGIILLAVSTNQFSLEGQAIFLNPDFQGTGALGADVQGVWYVGGEAGYVNGNIVFWNGFHYEVTDDAAFAGTDPSATPLAYTLLSKSVANGYIEEVDFIIYDFANDKILERNDKRENKVFNFLAIEDFQWGNNSVNGNIVNADCKYNCINNRGYISSNILLLSAIVNSTNDNINSITNTIFEQGTYNADFTTGRVKKCIFQNSYTLPITLISTLNHDGKEINGINSNFEADLDVTSAFAAGTLTIPITYNYIGIFNLLNSAGETIDEIINLPTTHKCRFYPTVGATQLFSHTAIGVAVADQLVSDAAAINTITGRTNGSDFIEYEKAGNLNRRYNAVILA